MTSALHQAQVGDTTDHREVANAGGADDYGQRSDRRGLGAEPAHSRGTMQRPTRPAKTPKRPTRWQAR